MKIKSLFKSFSFANDINNYPDAVIVVDYCNNITDWNIKAKEVFGYAEEEMIGRDIALIFDAEASKIREISKNQKSTVLSSKNGLEEDIFVEISCKDFPDKQKILITARDVTKNQKVIEKLLVEYETATKIVNNKSKFIIGLSSDFKTPIHSLIGFSQGLIDGICGDLNEKQTKYVSIINKNANNLLELVDNFMDLSALEVGSVEFNFKIFDIKKSLKQLCEKIKTLSEKKGLRFETDFTGIDKRNIYSDENMLSRAVFNVLENAIKYTEIGAVRLKVFHPYLETVKEAGIKVPDGLDEKSYLLFKVTDTGIGLNEEEKNIIFDEYSQLDRSIARKYGDTGLELALTRKILTALGGAIWIESDPGQGSTFNFIIPTEKAKQTEEAVEIEKLEEILEEAETVEAD